MTFYYGIGAAAPGLLPAPEPRGRGGCWTRRHRPTWTVPCGRAGPGGPPGGGDGGTSAAVCRTGVGVAPVSAGTRAQSGVQHVGSGPPCQHKWLAVWFSRLKPGPRWARGFGMKTGVLTCSQSVSPATPQAGLVHVGHRQGQGLHHHPPRHDRMADQGGGGSQLGDAVGEGQGGCPLRVAQTTTARQPRPAPVRPSGRQSRGGT